MPRNFSFRKEDNRPNDSFLGPKLFKTLEAKIHAKRESEVQRRQNWLNFQNQMEEVEKQKEEMKAVLIAGNANVDHRLAKELKEKYQMYCIWEKGIAPRVDKSQKNSLQLRQYLKNRKDQIGNNNAVNYVVNEDLRV